MATNQWERDRFNYGEAAGDGKGDFLHTHGVKAEHTDMLLFSWLSGGASEVRLPDALPVTRGGTGATTVAGAIRTLGYFEDANHILRRGTKVVSITNTGLLDRFQNASEAKFTRTGVGVYTITGVTYSTSLWGFTVPLTPIGLPKFFVEVTFANGTITVRTYVANNGTAQPTKGAAADIPAGQFVDIELK